MITFPRSDSPPRAPAAPNSQDHFSRIFSGVPNVQSSVATAVLARRTARPPPQGGTRNSSWPPFGPARPTSLASFRPPPRRRSRAQKVRSPLRAPPALSSPAWVMCRRGPRHRPGAEGPPPRVLVWCRYPLAADARVRVSRTHLGATPPLRRVQRVTPLFRGNAAPYPQHAGSSQRDPRPRAPP